LEEEKSKTIGINSVVSEFNNFTSNAIRSLPDRLQQQICFVDLSPIQYHFKHQYADVIHHPGNLSFFIGNLLLSSLY
jgi:hypothetical protein